jgi:hypothetical protein
MAAPPLVDPAALLFVHFPDPLDENDDPGRTRAGEAKEHTNGRNRRLNG